MIFSFYKWIVFFIFLITFQIKANNKNNISLKRNYSKKIDNFFLKK